MNSNSYVIELNELQIFSLQRLLAEKEWEFSQLPYAYWRASTQHVNVTAYKSGKVSVQGKNTADFVRFTLEPEITGIPRFDYETAQTVASSPDEFCPHAGIDESGKGDFFGALVIACCYTDDATAKILLESGVADSKTITSDKAIFKLEQIIKEKCSNRFAIVTLPPETYNRLYANFQNLNHLLGWGHAKALELLLDKVPDCPRAISDQFGKKENVRNALMEKGRRIILEQHPKAESDIAVAAASILARAEFVRQMEKLSNQFGIIFPKGAGPKIKPVGQEFISKYGKDALIQVAKLHFKTTAEL